jgi:hypothetical protein
MRRRIRIFTLRRPDDHGIFIVPYEDGTTELVIQHLPTSGLRNKSDATTVLLLEENGSGSPSPYLRVPVLVAGRVVQTTWANIHSNFTEVK